MAESLIACGFDIRSRMIWAKERLVQSRGDYHWQHEPAWYAVRGTGHWAGDRTQTTLRHIPSRDQDSDTVHATQKPVEYMRRPIANNSVEADAIYEPFSGSGTTIIAGEIEARRVNAMELKRPAFYLSQGKGEAPHNISASRAPRQKPVPQVFGVTLYRLLISMSRWCAGRTSLGRQRCFSTMVGHS